MTITPEAREAAASCYNKMTNELPGSMYALRHNEGVRLTVLRLFEESLQLAINSAVAEKDNEIERLKAELHEAKDWQETRKRLDATTSPFCEHNQQYSWSPDGKGKQIICLRCQNDSLKSRLSKLEEIAEGLAKASDSMLGIVSESRGITGWHLNGDVLNWEQCEFVDELASAHSAYQQYKEAKK